MKTLNTVAIAAQLICAVAMSVTAWNTTGYPCYLFAAMAVVNVIAAVFFYLAPPYTWSQY